MPRVGPGGDNVTGDRYTLDLGVEPDLGNLLQNLQVANDYLDQAEQRFRTISDVVGTTTQRLAQATRQTQMLAAETQRLQNSYAQIASSTMGVANMGMMPSMGMMSGMAGGGGGFMPGQMSFQGMGSPGGGNTIQTMPSRVVQDQNAGGFEGGQSTVAPHIPRMRFTEAEQGLELVRNLFGGKSSAGIRFAKAGGVGGVGGLASRFKVGRAAGLLGGWGAAVPGTGVQISGGIPGAIGGAAPAAVGEEAAGAVGLLGGVSSLAPYLAAGGYAATKMYGLWAGQQASARQLAGITGGEAGAAGMFGNNLIPGSISLGARARIMGFLNPGVDYGEIQQRALGAGYVETKGYEQARDYLFEAYKRGLGTTVDQMDLYVEAVDKSGASTGQLVQSMDQLRQVASNTNVSIGALYNNMKNQVETLTGMGMAGGAAVAQGTQGSVAFANARIASLDPNLRQAGGYDITSPFMQVQTATSLGIPVGSMAPYLSQHPGTNINVRGEAAAKDTLINMLGFQPGWTNEQIDAYVAQRGWGAFNADGTTILGNILQQLGILPQNFDPGEYTSIKRWIWTTLNEGPMSAQAKEARKAMKGTPIDVPIGVGEVGRSVASTADSWASSTYNDWYRMTGHTPVTSNIIAGAAGAISGVVGGVVGLFGGGSRADQNTGQRYTESTLGADLNSTLGKNLSSTFNKSGATTSPVLDRMMESDPGLTSTYVRLENGRIIRARDWINTPGHDWKGALESGRVQIAHAGDAAQQYLRGKSGLGLENSDVFTSGSLQFNTAEDEVGAPTTSIHGGTKAAEWKASDITGLDERTILRLADSIGQSVADHM